VDDMYHIFESDLCRDFPPKQLKDVAGEEESEEEKGL
jgi:hypothetical protein